MQPTYALSFSTAGGVWAAATSSGRTLRLACRQPDDRRHAGMAGAFVQLALFLDDSDVVEIAERAFQHLTGVQMFDLLWAARAVVKLLRRIALHDQQSAT